MNQEKHHIFIIAGETSGDMHGAELVKSIKEKRNEINISGIGGELLKNSGVELLYNYNDVNFIGFSSIIKNYSNIKNILFHSIEYVGKINPDIVILIDFPGFNLRFANEIRKFYKGKIIYYISPQVWAWHKGRVKKMKQIIDRMLVILPFEVDFYKNEGINAEYVGHPLIKKIDGFLSENKKVKYDKFVLTLLPGTRKEEIIKIFPILSETALRFKNEFDIEVNVMHPLNFDLNIYSRNNIIPDYNFVPNSGDNIYKTILNSDLVITKFGTSTLECALLETPFISVYKANYFNYFIAKTLSDIKYVSLPNILLQKEIVKEYLQNNMTVANLLKEGKKILFENDYKNNMINNFKLVKDVFLNAHIARSAEEIIIGEL